MKNLNLLQKFGESNPYIFIRNIKYNKNKCKQQLYQL